MSDFFRKLFTPWKAEDCFEGHDEYCRFLAARDKRLANVRIVFLIAAAILMMLGYALSKEVYNAWYYSCAGCLAVVLLLTLAIGRNEKELPKEMRQK
jgi:hypothetical protein